jgi:UDP-N-acetylmuramoyl-tripeptide--D-alanyl-D-alanine ligase
VRSKTGRWSWRLGHESMDSKSLSSISQLVGGELHGAGAIAVTAISTDSRSVQPGEFFVALRGENFDGHSFVPQAARAGAVGALVEHFQAGGFPQIVVPDTLEALQRLAAAVRAELPTRFVGITGSNGKTSTKEMVAAMLGETFRVVKTDGNLNNHIGVPLSLLRANREHDFAVLELGMNHPGEIGALAALVRPEIGLITNIGVAHIEFLGSRESIAAEKSALVEEVPPGGTVILNANDDFTSWIAGRTRARVLRAGLGQGDLQAVELVHGAASERFTLRGPDFETRVALPIVGQHMVENAVMAAALGYAVGMSPRQIAAGLGRTTIPGSRLKLQSLGQLTLINDSYNANPDSMIAALRTACNLPVAGRRIAVLGRMGELGEESVTEHERVGLAAAELGFHFLITVGDEARTIATAARRKGLKNAMPTADHAAAVSTLSEVLQAGDVVLVKGSFSARMDRVIAGLEAVEKQTKWRAP